jgi:metallophosphoesterase (TIGR03767 family)
MNTPRRESLSVLRACVAAAAILAGLSSPAMAADFSTTSDRVILDRDDNRLLEFGPGENLVLRQDLAAPRPGRFNRRQPMIRFFQLTDTHVVDEESPLRVEFLDQFGPPLTSAYRPQEGLSFQVLNQMAAQIRASTSVVSRTPVQLVMTTGDNSDNTQRNEVRGLIDILDGGVQVNPDSGVRGTCGTASSGLRYAGVRGGGDYYEPDRSSAAGDGEDGDGYSPRRAENQAEAGRTNRVRDFPGLYEAMNKPFRTVGLGVPWYSIFGNHDGLIQGNQSRTEAQEALAVGCTKVKALSPAALSVLQQLAAGGVTGNEAGQIARLVTDDMLNTARNPALAATLATRVPSDANRIPLKKVEYIREHFTTRGTPVGHGFREANLRTGQGNYSFSPRPGVRFVVLDSISENGGSDGNIDDAQFRWIHAELLRAESRREVVMLFAHHSLRTMNQSPASAFPPGDTGGNNSPLVHFGLGAGSNTDACALTSPSASPTQNETLRCLYLRHPSVIAFVVGHEHINRITPFERRNSANMRVGGFWEITTASHIDWPQQSRIIALNDNRDGTMSITARVIDHSSPVRANLVPTGTLIPASGVADLAAISRELSFNDPDAENGEDGSRDARGAARDRNVELLVKHPFPPR